MAAFKHPPFLNAGDKIAITSTARLISKEEIKWAKQKLESWVESLFSLTSMVM